MIKDEKDLRFIKKSLADSNGRVSQRYLTNELYNIGMHILIRLKKLSDTKKPIYFDIAKYVTDNYVTDYNFVYIYNLSFIPDCPFVLNGEKFAEEFDKIYDEPNVVSLAKAPAITTLIEDFFSEAKYMYYKYEDLIPEKCRIPNKYRIRDLSL